MADPPDAQGTGANVGFEDVIRDLERWANQVYASDAARTAAFAAATISPTEGMISYLQDVNRHEVHTGTAWVPLLGRATRKLADTPLTSQATPQVDPHLSLPLPVSSIVDVDLKLLFNGATGGDLGARLTFPAGTVADAIGSEGPNVLIGSGTDANADIWRGYANQSSPTPILFFGCAGTGIDLSARIWATLVTGATPGNLVLEWAQSAVNGTATTLRKGSSMRWRWFS